MDAPLRDKSTRQRQRVMASAVEKLRYVAFGDGDIRPITTEEARALLDLEAETAGAGVSPDERREIIEHVASKMGGDPDVIELAIRENISYDQAVERLAGVGVSPDECSVRAEFDYPHGGEVRAYEIRVYTQPPGRGAFTITTTARLCDKHRKWFKNGHVNLGIGDAA